MMGQLGSVCGGRGSWGPQTYVRDLSADGRTGEPTTEREEGLLTGEETCSTFSSFPRGGVEGGWEKVEENSRCWDEGVSGETESSGMLIAAKTDVEEEASATGDEGGTGAARILVRLPSPSEEDEEDEESEAEAFRSCSGSGLESATDSGIGPCSGSSSKSTVSSEAEKWTGGRG